MLQHTSHKVHPAHCSLQRLERERVLQQPAVAGETAALAGRAAMKVRSSQAQMTESGEEYFLTLPGSPAPGRHYHHQDVNSREQSNVTQGE